MKFDKILAISMAATMSVAFTACDSDDDDYVAATPEQGAKVYFLPENAKSVSLLDHAATIDVQLSRADNASALSVPVQFSASKDGVFTCPSSVDFAAGSNDATLTIAYDGTKLDYEEEVSFSITVDNAASSLYGISSYTCTAMIPAPWVSLGVGTIVDDYITGFFGVENVSWAVEIEANQIVPGYYRLVNPYGAGYPYNEPGDFDASKDYYLEIHAEDPAKVWIPTTTYGMDWGYGNFIFGSLAGYYMAKGDEASAAEYFGSLQDGIISFPADALLIGMSDYNDGGLYTCNGSGAFKIVMPGTVLADYSVTVAYTGKFYDVEDNLYIAAELTSMGADVESVRLAVTSTSNADAMIQAIATDATDAYVTLSAPGTVNLPMAADAESGKYCIVAVSYANGEAQEAAAATFKYTSLNGEPAESWTAYYIGNYTYAQCFEGTDEDLVLYGSDDDPLRCKIEPWGNGTAFVFNWDEDDSIWVEADQDMEFNHSSYGNFFVSDMTSVCPLVDGGIDWGTVLAAYFPDDCTGCEGETSSLDWDNYTFHFNVVYYTDKGNVMGWGYEEFMLTANAPAPRRGAAVRGANTVSVLPQATRNSHVNWLKKPLRLGMKRIDAQPVVR